MKRAMAVCGVLAGMFLLAYDAISGGSISLPDKVPYDQKKKEINGTYSVNSGWSISSVTVSGPINNADIKSSSGPITNKPFIAKYNKYSTTNGGNDGIVYLILSNNTTGVSENQANSPKTTTTIVHIDGSISFYSRYPYSDMRVTFSGITCYPPGMHGGASGNVIITGEGNSDPIPYNVENGTLPTTSPNNILDTGDIDLIGAQSTFSGHNFSGAVTYAGITYKTDELNIAPAGMIKTNKAVR